MRVLIALAVTISFLTVTTKITPKKTKVLTKNFFQKRAEFLKRGLVQIPLFNGKNAILNLGTPAIASESDCDAVLEAVDGEMPSYTAGSLSYFNGTLYKLNNRNSADVENVFCHFVNTMGMDGSEGTETAEIEEEEGTMYVQVEITDSPTEGFAGTEGYTKKAVVRVSEDDSSYITYMVMYWGFADGSTDTTTTRGFLIEGSPKTLGGTRAGYMKWDLTGTTQTGQFYAAEFPSAEDEEDRENLTPANYFMADSEAAYQGDSFSYGRFSFNTDTNEVHIQGITVEGERQGAEGTPEAYGCFKIYGTGTKGGMMVIAKSRDKHSSDTDADFGFARLGHLTDGDHESAVSLLGMDAACLVDLTTTDNMKGNLGRENENPTQWRDNIITALNTSTGNSIDADTVIFDTSCEAMVTLNASGSNEAFDSDNGTSWVDFTAGPSDIFGESNADNLTAPTREELCTNLNENDVSADTRCYCPTAESGGDSSSEEGSEPEEGSGEA